MSGVVYVVDDDEMVRDSLTLLLEGAGYTVRAFADGDSFLQARLPREDACILLDVAMPGSSGLQVQQELARRSVALPVLFLTAYGDVPTAVRAVKAGAAEFLQKPIEGRELLAKVGEAVARSLDGEPLSPEAALAVARFETLTPRERDVMALVVTGLQNKEIARRLGISHRTVEIHRGRMMRKMQASSVVDLVGMSAPCGLAVSGPAEHPAQR